VFEVHLEHAPAGHRRVRVAGVDAEVLGERHRALAVADAVDVGERQPGVIESLGDHPGFERPAGQLELARG
jgi:hypothetical protein